MKKFGYYVAIFLIITNEQAANRLEAYRKTLKFSRVSGVNETMNLT